ncbi:MAG TPA: hypothetical protein VD794_09445, partial [Flavisolibacter sp.]|nr:hypothetical protein [Flavisolibacter sp.]
MQLHQNKGNVKSQESFVSGLVFKYLPYWPLFIVVILLFVAGAYCYLLFVTPKYEALASLVLKDERKKGSEPA